MSQYFTQFGPDPDLSTLPQDFRSCIKSGGGCDAAYNLSDCDDIVGSLAHGHGYCSDPTYASTTYCACVNSPTPAAACFFAPCVNSAYAYAPCAQQGMVKRGNCPKGAVICNQIFSVGGAGNVVTNVTQQCGVINNIVNQVRANPAMAIVLMVLVLMLAAVVATKPRPDDPAPVRAPARAAPPAQG